MKYTQFNLAVPQDLGLHGIRTIKRQHCNDQINGLRVTWSDGHHLDLPSAVDVSEQINEPRIFLIEGIDPEKFLIFGGEIAFWLNTKGVELSHLKLFRKNGLEEYWTTTIVEQPAKLIIIYEAGVLVMDESLKVLLHKPKLINDFFVGFDNRAIRFVRDHDKEWLMPLDYASP